MRTDEGVFLILGNSMWETLLFRGSMIICGAARNRQLLFGKLWEESQHLRCRDVGIVIFRRVGWNVGTLFCGDFGVETVGDAAGKKQTRKR